jgi:purine-binding chemotaxis protein CheW
MKQTKINWTVVRERLRTSERALEAASTPDPLRIEDVYRERAVRLASVEVKRQSASPELSALVFRLGRERYVVEMSELAEVLQFARCVPVPGASRKFLGVMNVRGEIRPVLDLGQLLAASDTGTGDGGFVLMLRRPRKEIGLKVDQIEHLRQIRPEELTSSIHGTYGKGLVSGTVMLLDVGAVLEAALSKEELGVI